MDACARRFGMITVRTNAKRGKLPLVKPYESRSETDLLLLLDHGSSPYFLCILALFGPVETYRISGLSKIPLPPRISPPLLTSNATLVMHACLPPAHLSLTICHQPTRVLLHCIFQLVK